MYLREGRRGGGINELSVLLAVVLCRVIKSVHVFMLMKFPTRIFTSKVSSIIKYLLV